MNTVPLDITIREIPNSEAVEARIRQKADKLGHYYDRVEFCKVVVGVTQKQHHQGKLYNTHVEVGVPGKRLVATRKQDQDLYIAIRDAFNAVNRQVQRYANRQQGAIKTHQEALSGYIVRKFDDYGFIETLGGDEYYFHASNVLNLPFEALEIGKLVTFLDVETGDSLQASHVNVREELLHH